MKVLVTGAAGYIGSVLVPLLLARGDEVVALDSFLYNQTSLLGCCHDPRLTVIRGDARDRRTVGTALAGCGAAIPLACLTGAPRCEADPIGARTTNLGAVALLLELCRPEQRVVFPSTDSAYGMTAAGAVTDERSPLRPTSLYARLKVEAERLVLDAGGVTLRLATAFGASPRMRLDLLVNDFVYRAVTDRAIVLFEGSFRRDLIHVRDIARALLHCLDRFDQMRGEPYNAGIEDVSLTKQGICDEIKRQVPDLHVAEAALGMDPDRRDYAISHAKIAATGYQTAYTLQQGIAELITACQIVRRNQFANL